MSLLGVIVGSYDFLKMLRGHIWSRFTCLASACRGVIWMEVPLIYLSLWNKRESSVNITGSCPIANRCSMEFLPCLSCDDL